MRHVLRAKAVLCPGLRVSFLDEATGDKDDWYYEDGLKDYLAASTQGFEVLPPRPLSATSPPNTPP